MSSEMTELVGRSIRRVELKDGELLFFTIDNTIIRYDCEGDCCSSSWFEEIDNPDALIDARVVSVESVDLDKVIPDISAYECLRLYGTKITTTKGNATVDMRNSSNGYYGGWINYRGEKAA